jgi:hypothetical protein
MAQSGYGGRRKFANTMRQDGERDLGDKGKSDNGRKEKERRGKVSFADRPPWGGQLVATMIAILSSFLILEDFCLSRHQLKTYLITENIIYTQLIRWLQDDNTVLRMLSGYNLDILIAKDANFLDCIYPFWK